jgi:predicted transcriptional regulator of viral defense system
MRLIDALGKIKGLGQASFHSSDVAALLKISRGHASKLMSRLVGSGAVFRLTRGRWVLLDGIEPLLIPEFLSAPSPSYISLQTALFHHGMISQIPSVIYAVTTSKTRRYKTPAGTFSLHHIEPEFFFGFSATGDRAIKMASPEKALVDYLYLSPGRSKIFRTLPELELLKSFRMRYVYEIIKQIKFKSRRTLVKRKLDNLLQTSSASRFRANF